MSIKKIALLTLLLIGSAVSVFAQSYVTWSYGAKKVSDTEVELTMTAQIADEFHMYSMKKAEGGPLPLVFKFTPSPDYELVGGTTSTSKLVEEYDEIFEMNLSYYSYSAVFKQRIKVKSMEPFTIVASLSYQVCGNDTCVPGGEDFSVSITTDMLPTGQPADAERTAGVEGADSIAVVPPAGEDTAIESSAETAEAQAAEEGDDSLLSIILMALGFGLAAVFTPCVFPMIPMTVSFFMSGSSSRFATIMKAVIFSLSVALVYTVIGVIVAIFKTPAIGEAISTHWIPNLIFAAIFVIFAASFLGMFEITLPSGLANKADKQVDKGGYVASFFMAVVLAIVSFSCTGPFVGGLLIEAAQGTSALKPIVGMCVFGLALSLPFVLLAVFPSLLEKMPKSGGWLNAIKVVFAFIMLGFGVKFLSQAGVSLKTELISRTIAIAFWTALAILLGIYFLGKIKFSHDSDVKHVSVPRFVLALASFVFAIYLLPGLFGADLNAVSAFLPAKDESTFDLSARQVVAGDNTSAVSGTEAPCGGKPKFSETKMHLPKGINGYFDIYEAIACAKEQNKPILLDFKGYGCANCKKMESSTFTDQRVIDLINKEFIMVGLYNDEFAELPKEDQLTSSNGKPITTIGDRNVEYQQVKFSNIARPYFAIIDANENVLEKGLGMATADELIEFLEKGLKAYKNR